MSGGVDGDADEMSIGLGDWPDRPSFAAMSQPSKLPGGRPSCRRVLGLVALGARGSASSELDPSWGGEE